LAKRYTIISDLHLGDGTPADTFQTSNAGPLLADLLQSVRADLDNHLILLGDIMELWKFSLEQVMAFHAGELDQMLALAADGRLTWVIGNHDFEPVNRFLPFRRIFGTVPLVQELVVPELGLYMAHGHLQDPHVDRLIPMPGEETAYEFSRTFVYYLKYLMRISPHLDEHLTTVGLAVQREIDEASSLGRALMAMPAGQRREALIDIARRLVGYKTAAEAGRQEAAEDPWERAAFAIMATGGYRHVVFGHTHRPGVVRRGGLTYLNSGSWCSADRYPATFVRADAVQQTVTLWCMEPAGAVPYGPDR
jgi:UDP-2,3-diacylglucosamine pyrophosphatase LpxH